MDEESAPNPTRQEGVRFSGTRRRLTRTFLLSVLVGILSGFAAWVMESGIHYLVPLFRNRDEVSSLDILTFDWGRLLLPAGGGLLSGLVVVFLCRRAHAHGTAILIDAFHHRGGRMRLSDSLYKAVAAVFVIAMGCSVGKEAAIAVLAAAMGSALAGIFRMSPRERRIFLVAGCAAGVGAIFQCPLGGALFAVTILYREPEIEADGLMPSIVSSVTAYSVFITLIAFVSTGTHPDGALPSAEDPQFHRLLTGTDSLTFKSAAELPAYIFLGFTCALAAFVFYYCLKGSSLLAERSRLPRWFTPAAAGLIGGAIACAFPQVMDSGYLFIQNSLDKGFLEAHPWIVLAGLFALIGIAKCVATGLMIGTDTAGGLFGPAVFIGGIVGAATGAFLEAIFPAETFPPDLRAALIPVGMAGMISASLRVPLAAVVMVMEMTGSFGLIVPLMLTSVVGYLLGRRWGVYAEQVSGIEDSPAHAGESVVSILENWKVADLIEKAWPHIIHPATPLPEVAERLKEGTRPVFAVLRDDRLVGLVSLSDVARAKDMVGPTSVVITADIMTAYPRLAYPGDDLYSTLDLFRRGNLEVIPVVHPENGRFLGMLSRAAILRALRERMEADSKAMLREHAGMVTLAQEGRIEELLSGFPEKEKEHVERMTVPDHLVGRSLAQSNFRSTYGEVIAVQSADGKTQAPPDPARPFAPGDQLILLPKPPVE